MTSIVERLRRSPENKQELPPHEIAMQLREVQLDLFDHGAIGSEKPVPHEPNPKATKLPTLLRYSPIVLRHMQTMRGVLAAPHEFQITEEVEQLWRDGEADGDVIFSREGENLVYYFAHHLTSPYLNAWTAGFDKHQRSEPYMNVAIVEHNEKHPNLWIASYSFCETQPGNALDTNNISMSNLYPEREMILNFWYSPDRLDGQYFQNKFPAAQIVKDNLTLMSEEQSGDFRHFVFHYDSLAHAKREQAFKAYCDPYYHQQVVDFLRRKGNFEFSIVELGTTELGGQKHWIYTGSECASIQVKEDKKVPMASRQWGPQLK